jgi:endonuclease/exonuclease/phosphatase family metal-dependent hydrolase
LMGDFNDWVPLSRIERTLSRYLGPPSRARSFPAGFPLLPLDRIWVYPRRLLLELRAMDTPLTRQASDHLPVLARLRLAATKARGSPSAALSEGRALGGVGGSR